MTSTDRAFIAAFRREQLPPAVPKATTHVASPGVSGMLGVNVELVTYEVPDLSLTIGSPPTALAEKVLTVEKTAATKSSETRRILHGPHPVVTPGVAMRRPLSSYTTSSADEESEDFQPSIVVPHLRWPPVCLRLGAEHSNRLTTVLEAIGRLPGDSAKIVGIAANSPHAGCTTLTMALARQAARLGRRIALLEANAVAPSFQPLFGLQTTDGLSEVLSAQIPLTQATMYAHDDRVAVIAWGDQPASPLNSRQRLQLSLAAGRLRFAYDLVLVDLGQPTADNRHAVDVFSALHGDATLIVSTHRRETPPVSELQQLLETVGRPVVGVIENAAP